MPPAAKTRKTAVTRETYHHNDLPKAVIAKAVELITARGGPDFSLREIATALGVSHSAVYRHFADKTALLNAVTALGFEALGSYQAQAQAAADSNPLDELRALCVAYVTFAREQPGYFALMFHSHPVTEDTARTIRQAQAAGLIIPGNAERIAAYLVLAPHGMASFHAQGHVPAFIAAHQKDGPLSADWLSEVALAPLLATPLQPDQFARRFFDAPEG
ncbi:MAG: TetR/AcrR family transcriptional regulator [Maritimibacter sp.]